MAKPDELQLIQRSIMGDREAFAELVRLYSDAVYGLCFNRTRSFEDARDLAQETFIRAYTRIHELRDPSRFAAWIRRIAENLCSRWMQSRREILPIQWGTSQASQPGQSPSTELVREALENIPENERLVVILHYINGYTYSDIARFLGVTQHAVRGRLHRGRKKLRLEVLKVMKEALDKNRPDEKLIIEAVNRALREAHDAYNILENKDLSRSKVGQARELIEKVNTTSPDDPIALGQAFLELSTREFILEEHELSQHHLQLAMSLFEQAGHEDGIQSCYARMAYEKMYKGNLPEAHELFLKIEEHWKARRLKDPNITNFQYLAIARGLEALGLQIPWNLTAYFRAGESTFEIEDNLVLYRGGMQFGACLLQCPERSITTPYPKEGFTSLPLVLIKREPEAGDTLRFINIGGYSEESVVDTKSESVTTPAGIFTNCAVISNKVFSTGDWTGEVTATRRLWFAPGVGMVRLTLQATGKPEDHLELVEYHIEKHSDSYMPIAVGNWWKSKWVEGEKEFGFRTETYREIVARSERAFVAIEYEFAASRQA